MQETVIIDFIFSVAILIMSIVVHEVSHGLVANLLGDPTAKYEGRLTLNPIKHLDPFGSVILPVMTFLIGGVIFGWAKPVPYNPYNLKNQRIGPALVGAAGPASNFLIAIIFALILRFAGSYLTLPLLYIMSLIVLVNILLAIFNLVPIPPLDGSKVLFALFPPTWYEVESFLEQYGFIFLIVFIYLFWGKVAPVISVLFKLFTGFSL
ncbi:hypothetical protein A2Z53_02290 [Candidatus Giovannonibacteria bacterium RIFCSPHIGHO2_02_42_15]|uniref:Peptidase M50 domain-containing protein n=2 Tax=Candidatus Giovannoniibacteriota TaxID=1752738 RepID=A0A1F5VK78_9BACT|nr:MAG: hypothetical protein UV11_C0035G0026 [Candidatus Giovannonibacteria bacterium GW2011_GWF2_42_19]OGF63804.1 MAG: hypothetical protein A2Z53_02290 [Candidatus Giovannonibacteria bacterium RIFCSPHIGHO2_02_42_15]